MSLVSLVCTQANKLYLTVFKSPQKWYYFLKKGPCSCCLFRICYQQCGFCKFTGSSLFLLYYHEWLNLIIWFQCDIILQSKFNVSESFLQGGPHNHTVGGLAVCLKYVHIFTWTDGQLKELCLIIVVAMTLGI